MNIMHNITSHKGGVGKTITALSLAQFYLYDPNNHVTLVDCNPMNSNIADDLFYYFHQEDSKLCKCIPDAIERTYTISPESPRTFNVIDATHLRLPTTIRLLEELAPIDEVRSHIYILDTNEHIKNLATLETPYYGEFWRQYYWFIWGWSTPRLHHNVSDVFKAVSNIEEQFPIRQVVHVFNMYDFYNVGFSILKRPSVKMKPLYKILKVFDRRIRAANKKELVIDYADHKIMHKWIAATRRELLMYVVPRDLEVGKIPEIWATTFKGFLDISNSLPYNILLIPTFFEELVMSMDRLIMGEHRSWKGIYKAVSPMMKFIRDWAGILDKYSK